MLGYPQTLQSWRLAAQVRWYLLYAGTIQLEYLQRMAGLQFGKVAQAAHVGENTERNEVLNEFFDKLPSLSTLYLQLPQLGHATKGARGDRGQRIRSHVQNLHATRQFRVVYPTQAIARHGAVKE